MPKFTVFFGSLHSFFTFTFPDSSRNFLSEAPAVFSFSTFPLQTTSPTQRYSCRSAPNFKFAAAAQTEEKFSSSPQQNLRLPLILPRRSVSSSSSSVGGSPVCVIFFSLSRSPLLDADALLAEKTVFDRLYPSPLQKTAMNENLFREPLLLTKICAPLVAFSRLSDCALHNWAGRKQGRRWPKTRWRCPFDQSMDRKVRRKKGGCRPESRLLFEQGVFGLSFLMGFTLRIQIQAQRFGAG